MDEALSDLLDEHRIRRLILIWLDGIDTRDPAKIRAAWAEEMETEFIGFPDMGGGPIAPGRHRTADRAEGLIRMIGQFSMTQHVSTNHLVTIEGDRATCSAYVLATHHMEVAGREPWSVIGARYDIEAARLAVGWRLTRLKWTRLWTSGNDALWAEAGRRMAAEAAAPALVAR
ncbi:nuclear transport factor 2 family protein [Rhizorhabdus dicambivorans]|uniref:Nuclear transport factor 2 family protein n=1 Tax=Rhizorhabdus dicambivorans TaxID=1850238 RepID=A0A2A4FZ74_9SPHN|nr:nuclear transport factor 2 family protein [Rhizorhabdus dicambivorans]ATE63671.1 nuclear transport factor 2 family protein [Rhizorhabdus dicambivorans]PCE42799.1 nuclear transport factor 2 family protein [Rhizorhabdus dicambivorans]